MATFILFPNLKYRRQLFPLGTVLTVALQTTALYYIGRLSLLERVQCDLSSPIQASVFLREKWQTIWKCISLRKHWHFFWLQSLLVSCNKWSCIQSCCLPRRSIGSKLFQIFSFLFIFSVKLASCVMSTVIAFTKTLILVFCFFSPGF